MVDQSELESSIDRQLQDSADYYIKDFENNAGGPQYSGLTPEKFTEAWTDPDSIWVELGEAGIKWPVVVPVSYNIDYRSEFFSTHFPDQQANFLSIPSSLTDIEIEKMVAALKERAASDLARPILTYDYCGEDRKSLYDSVLDGLRQEIPVDDITPESEAFGMVYGSPKVVHFDTLLTDSDEKKVGDISIIESIKRSKIEAGERELPKDGAAIVTTDHLEADDDALLAEVWSMYEEQFEELVEDHPSLQIQPKEELFKMLKDPSSLNVGFFEDGKLVAMTYFVTNIGACVWLKEGFYNDTAKSDDEQVLYFPGIVVKSEKARQGAEYVPMMLEVSREVLFGDDVSQDARITFQCTNVSATYIPKIVSDFVAESVQDRIAVNGKSDQYGIFSPMAEYDYKVLSLG